MAKHYQGSASTVSTDQHFIPEIKGSFSQVTMIIIIEELSGNPKCENIRQPEPKAVLSTVRGRAQKVKRYNPSKSPQLLTEQKRYADTPQKCGDVR